MGRGVRPVSREGIEALTDAQLAAYIADTRLRVAQMSKASLRKNYANELRLAVEVQAHRTSKADLTNDS